MGPPHIFCQMTRRMTHLEVMKNDPPLRSPRMTHPLTKSLTHLAHQKSGQNWPQIAPIYSEAFPPSMPPIFSAFALLVADIDPDDNYFLQEKFLFLCEPDDPR
jgi:hypothetical protein